MITVKAENELLASATVWTCATKRWYCTSLQRPQVYQGDKGNKYCWMGITKSIRPVKIKRWRVGVVIYLQQGGYDLLCGPPDATATRSSLASLKFRLVQCFWCRLTRVILENRMLNICLSKGSASILRQKLTTDMAAQRPCATNSSGIST